MPFFQSFGIEKPNETPQGCYSSYSGGIVNEIQTENVRNVIVAYQLKKNYERDMSASVS